MAHLHLAPLLWHTQYSCLAPSWGSSLSVKIILSTWIRAGLPPKDEIVILPFLLELLSPEMEKKKKKMHVVASHPAQCTAICKNQFLDCLGNISETEYGHPIFVFLVRRKTFLSDIIHKLLFQNFIFFMKIGIFDPLTSIACLIQKQTYFIAAQRSPFPYVKTPISIKQLYQ